MNKELEALDDFIKDYLDLCKKLCTNKQEKMLLDSNSPYNVLKTYLEAIDNANPSKALRWIDNYIDWNCKKIEELKNRDKGVADIYDNENKMLVNIKQALLKAQEQEKVLDIIKKKDVDIQRLMKCINVATYNNGLPKNRQLTKEEFELLKEVLEE